MSDAEQSARDLQAREWFRSQQERMLADLREVRTVQAHPTAKGDGSELHWLQLLTRLPSRYQAERAFVIDSDGRRSQQIDIVIHDRQFCPCLLDTAGGIHIPSESVYAVFEVKQDLSKGNLEYAGDKIASVRQLKRTSASFPHAFGVSRTTPKSILGGILAFQSGWSPSFGARFLETIAATPVESRVDLGCALSDGAFEVTYQDDGAPHLSQSDADTSLIFFFLRLAHRLQQVATVPAIDYLAYSRLLVVGEDEAAQAAGLLPES
jgi:hypothetical protein